MIIKGQVYFIYRIKYFYILYKWWIFFLKLKRYSFFILFYWKFIKNNLRGIKLITNIFLKKFVKVFTFFFSKKCYFIYNNMFFLLFIFLLSLELSFSTSPTSHQIKKNYYYYYKYYIFISLEKNKTLNTLKTFFLDTWC